MFFFVVTADAHTTPLVTQGCLFLVSHDTGWKLCPPSWCHLLVSFTPHTQLRVLRGCSAPPTISPLTTRSGRKRKLQKPNTEVYVSRHLTLKLFVLTDVFHSPSPPPILFSYSHQPSHGLLNVSMVTGWFSDVLHHFITVK